MIDELCVVELAVDLSHYGLHAGQRGTVLVRFESPIQAYLVEFDDADGVPCAQTEDGLVTLLPEQIKLV